MLLDGLKLKRIYRSKRDNIDEELIIPALTRSIKYDRGTGYFSLSSLANFSTGLIPFIKNGGNIRIITSVDLEPEDREVIKKGHTLEQYSIIDTLKKEIEMLVEDPLAIIKLDFITNLIAAKRLTIKIAYIPQGGIYHEKIGILKDENDNMICFLGSQNETYSGYKLNLESTVVMTSWTDELENILSEEKYFEELWNNQFYGVEVFTFPEALENNLFNKYKESDDLEAALRKLEQAFFDNTRNKKKELYPYQEEAIKEFMNNGYSHFYEMATGTGKTFTAVKTIEMLIKGLEHLCVIVLVPQVDLQLQWAESFKEIEQDVIFFGGIAGDETENNLNRFIIESYTKIDLVVAISTYDTYFSKVFDKIKRLPQNTMLIIDEAHNLSPNQIIKLPQEIKLRLGLSATPERYNKQETNAIVSYFTQNRIETFKYTIEEAIKNNFLSKYEYFPFFVHMDDEEFISYQNYTKQLIYLENQDKKDHKRIQDVRNLRSLIVKKTNTKITKLKEIISNNSIDFRNCVIYCGQGKDVESDESIINTITRNLTLLGKYKVSQFTSKTVDRDKVLMEFENGYYDVLVAIKCFDEGVDVPKLDRILIMASDALTRQTIQRRGRVLRKCTETGKEKAYIYDMVVLPPLDQRDGLGVNSLVSNELRRVIEYSKLAENNSELNKIIDLTKSDYRIKEISDGE